MDPQKIMDRKGDEVTLFSPLQLGDLSLRNRIVMAPMTRSRADSNAVPSELMVEYYRQRASAGMIITEGIAPSADGLGYCRTPGIFSREQVEAWRRVTGAVHAAGGCIVAQIMHVGRVSNKLNKPDGAATVAPSPIQARGEIYTDQGGLQPLDIPRELETDEIIDLVDQYQTATENVFAAGFDGVELHCASGYLPAQFLSTGTNRREDRYGGCLENRARFALEVLSCMADIKGARRVGFRICPDNAVNDLEDENPEETFDYLLQEARLMDLAYLHVIRLPKGRVDNIALGQRYFGDRLIANESFSYDEARQMVAQGQIAAASFGRYFIGNPDLVERWKTGTALAGFDNSTLYTAGAEGYTSYPRAT